MSDVIALVGFASSGKSAAADKLMTLGYESIAFADSLKDCLSAIFGWDREALAGHTPESRAWREQVDPWWATRLNIPEFSPRWAMRNFGTDVMRQYFHQEIWIASAEQKMDALAGRKIVLTDARFPNELRMAHGRGARTIRIRRGPDPEWMETARVAADGCSISRHKMLFDHEIHESEWAWIGEPVDHLIENDRDLDHLHTMIWGLAR